MLLYLKHKKRINILNLKFLDKTFEFITLFNLFLNLITFSFIPFTVQIYINMIFQIQIIKSIENKTIFLKHYLRLFYVRFVNCSNFL